MVAPLGAFFMVIFLVFILGIVIGSFLGVVVDRLPRGKTIVRGRSHCDNCKHILSPLDLLPLVSFLALQGKCRYCHKSIGLSMFIIEILTGTLFAITFLFVGSVFANQLFSFSFFTSLLYYLYIVSSLIAIFFIDLQFGIIPNKIVYSAIVISILYVFFFLSI